MEEARALLERVSRFEQELIVAKSAEFTEKRNSMIDGMITNIADPRAAEKLRIYKSIESQFDKIEREVKEEVRSKLDRIKKDKENIKKPSDQAKQLIEKAKNLRLKEQKRQLKISKQNESIIFPENKGRIVSFTEHINHQDRDTKFKFQVLEKTTAPVTVKRKVKNNKENIGCYEVRSHGTGVQHRTVCVSEGAEVQRARGAASASPHPAPPPGGQHQTRPGQSQHARLIVLT